MSGRAAAAFVSSLMDGYRFGRGLRREGEIEDVQTAAPGMTEQALAQTEPEKAVTLPGIDGAPAEKLTVGGDLKLARTADFLGERVNPDDKAGIERTRRGKVADVLGKYDPAEGARMRREIRADERADWVHGREKKRAEREDKAQADDDAYTRGRTELASSLRFGKNLAAHAEQLKAWKAAGGQGEPPARPAYSTMDSIADQSALLDFDAQHGKLDTKAFGDFTKQLQTLQDEGYEKALRQAHAGAALPQVLQAFNASGKERVSPADVVKDERVAGPDGAPTRRITLKDGTVIDTLASLDALGKAGEVFSRHYKAKDDKRDDKRLELDGKRVGLDGARLGLAQRADGRAQAEFDAGKPLREAAAETARLQSQARSQDPKVSGPAIARLKEIAQVDAITRGRTSSGAYKFDGGEISNFLGDPATDSKGAPITDPMTGRQQVNRNPEREREFSAWMLKNGYTDSNEALPKFVAEKAAQRGGVPVAPPAAVDMLRKNPALREQFEAKYGPGSAGRALGN